MSTRARYRRVYERRAGDATPSVVARIAAAAVGADARTAASLVEPAARAAQLPDAASIAWERKLAASAFDRGASALAIYRADAGDGWLWIEEGAAAAPSADGLQALMSWQAEYRTLQQWTR